MARILVVLVLLAFASGPAFAGPDEDSVGAAMKRTWDRPDAPVVVSPVAVSGNHAIAGWTQGDMGGRALLGRRHGQWTVLLCAGDALLQAEALKHAGLAPAPAEQLLARAVALEREIPAARRAQFSKFEGLVTMDAAGAHAPTGAANGHRSQQ